MKNKEINYEKRYKKLIRIMTSHTLIFEEDKCGYCKNNSDELKSANKEFKEFVKKDRVKNRK